MNVNEHKVLWSNEKIAVIKEKNKYVVYKYISTYEWICIETFEDLDTATEYARINEILK